MKKYNLSNIMKRAWQLVKETGLNISEGLKKAWKEAKMTSAYIKVRDWFIDKTEETSSRYNCFIDIYSRDENGCVKSEDGFYIVKIDEVISESEKAIQVRLNTGDVVGSYKGWKTWIPKSLIKEVA